MSDQPQTSITNKRPLEPADRSYLIMLLLMEEAYKWHDYINQMGYARQQMKSHINTTMGHYKMVKNAVLRDNGFKDFDWLEDLTECFSVIVQNLVDMPTEFDMCQALQLLKAQVE